MVKAKLEFTPKVAKKEDNKCRELQKILASQTSQGCDNDDHDEDDSTEEYFTDPEA